MKPGRAFVEPPDGGERTGNAGPGVARKVCYAVDLNTHGLFAPLVAEARAMMKD
jgi:hypothetical protein